MVMVAASLVEELLEAGMINAKEALALSTKIEDKYWALLEERIRKAAETGYQNITMQPDMNWNKLKIVKQKLEDNGFKVEIVSDQRDGDYLSINW